MIYRTEITRGFDGVRIDGVDFDVWNNAMAYIRREIRKHVRNVDEVWTFTELPDKCVTVIDVGSHTIFARITEIKEENE